MIQLFNLIKSSYSSVKHHEQLMKNGPLQMYFYLIMIQVYSKSKGRQLFCNAP